MFPGSEDVYKAWSFVWYAWFVLRLQRVASVAFGREILALRKAHTQCVHNETYKLGRMQSLAAKRASSAPSRTRPRRRLASMRPTPRPSTCPPTTAQPAGT